MKLSAVEAIRKFYYEKGFRNISISMSQDTIEGISNGVSLTFDINKGNKVKINSINFAGNEYVDDAKLRKQMKGTKEMPRLTFYPEFPKSPYGDTLKATSFKSYLKDNGFLFGTKTLNVLNPYFRYNFFSAAKFNEIKYIEDKDKILDYYNTQGLRDASIIADTQVINDKGNLDIHIKLNEGHKYYFGHINWKGNTKYSDSILNLLLGIGKGEVYNMDLLNKRLGKQLSAEGGDISSLYQDDGYLFFHIDPIETAVYNDTIDFEIRMAEGPQATYGKITVTGNDKTKDYVVLRELRTLPGQKIQQSRYHPHTKRTFTIGLF